MALLDGRRAVVTGAGDIGAAIAGRLAAHGAAVEVWDVSSAALSRLPDGIGRRVVDVTDHEALPGAVEAACAALGGVDTLVNAAAIAIFATVAEMSPVDWRRIIDVNLTGTFLTCQAFLPRLVEAGHGSIVNISSIGGLRGEPAFSGYCAAKFGVIGLTQSLAREVGQYGIRVNAICPGAVESQMNTDTMARDARLNGTTVGDVEARIIAKTALRRLVQPEEIGDACVYLASHLSACVTAESLSVTGGVF